MFFLYFGFSLCYNENIMNTEIPTDDLPEDASKLDELLDERGRTEFRDMKKKSDLALRVVSYLWKTRDLAEPDSFDDLLDACSTQLEEICYKCQSNQCMEDVCPVYKYRVNISAALM